ncbi:MAG: S1 RNA-binding domain-containing protein, partial [Pseudomonadota bacterium]
AEIERLDTTATHISETERRSMTAERDTTDRYLAAYLSERVGHELEGRISGIARFGVFVKLDETGADGLVPMRALGQEYFHHDRDSQTLMGADTGRVISLGQRVRVRLAEAVPVTGGLMLDLLELDGEEVAPGPTSSGIPRRKGGGKGAPVRRKPGQARARDKAAKVKEKRRVTRKRRER